MVKGDFIVRKIDGKNENAIFEQIYSLTSKSHGSDFTLFNPQIIQCNNQTYALYEQRYDLIPVRLKMADEVFYFGDNEGNDVEYLTVDEINLLRSLGKIAIDGTSYKIIDATFGLIDTACGAQRLFTFMLKEDKQNG